MRAEHNLETRNRDVAELLTGSLSPDDRHHVLVLESVVRDSTYGDNHLAGCSEIYRPLRELRMSALEEKLGGMRRESCCNTRGSQLVAELSHTLPGVLDVINTLNAARAVVEILRSGRSVAARSALEHVLALDLVVDSAHAEQPYTQRAAELAELEKDRLVQRLHTLYRGRNGAIHAQEGNGWRESEFGQAIAAASGGGPLGMAVIVAVKRENHLATLRSWALGEEIFRHNGLILVRTGKQLAHLAAQALRSTTPLLSEWEPSRARWESEAMLALDLISNSPTPILELTRREAEALLVRAFQVAPAACA